MFQMLLPLASKMLTTKVMMSAGAKMMLSAGASALGTHLDNQQIKKQNRRAAAEARARQGNFYVNLRNAAQRAGFDPLTVLRSGTAGAYQAEGNSYDVLPMLTSNSFANMLMNAEESQVRMDNMRAQERNMQHQQNMDKLNYDLRKAELELGRAQIGVMASGNGDYEPTPTGIDPKDIPGEPEMPDGFVAPKETVEQFPPTGFGRAIHPAPLSPAAVIEEQYGDGISWVYGAFKLTADVVNTGHVEWNKYLKNKGYVYTPPVFARNTRNNRGIGVIGYTYKKHKVDQELPFLQ
jgi:hypothetical protein